MISLKLGTDYIIEADKYQVGPGSIGHHYIRNMKHSSSMPLFIYEVIRYSKILSALVSLRIHDLLLFGISLFLLSNLYSFEFHKVDRVHYLPQYASFASLHFLMRFSHCQPCARIFGSPAIGWNKLLDNLLN